MSKFVFSGLAASVIGGAMLLSGTAPASAVTLPSAAVGAPAEAEMVEKVQTRERRARRGGDRRYDRRRHGPRYSYRRPGFRHYHGGYYYSSPWWSAPSIGFGITVPGVTLGLGGGYGGYGGYGGHSAHVQWCLNRYRTYDPATDTYIPRVGERAYCNSPYS